MLQNIYIILFSLSYKNGYQKSYSGKENANVKCQHRSKKMVFCYQNCSTYCKKNCSSDREKLLKFEAKGREFAKFLRTLEQFIQTVKCQNNSW